MPISTSAMWTSADKKLHSRIGGALPPIYWTGLAPHSVRVGPFDTGHETQQFGQHSGGRTPDEILGDSEEIDREVAVGVGAGARLTTTPPFLREGAVGQYLAERDREGPIDFGGVRRQRRTLRQEAHDRPDRRT